MTQQTEVEALQNKLTNYQINISDLKRDNDMLHAQVEKIKQANGKLIYGKMIAIKKDLSHVGKDQTNSGQGFKFRGIDQFQNALKPLLDKHEVGITVETLGYPEPKFVEVTDKFGVVKKSKNVAMIIKYTFFASDGSTIFCTLPAEGVDPGDKGTNKALSAAFKYCMIQTFCVPTEDQEEGDKETVDMNKSEKKTKAGNADWKFPKADTTVGAETVNTLTLTPGQTSGVVSVTTTPLDSIPVSTATSEKPGQRFRKPKAPEAKLAGGDL